MKNILMENKKSREELDNEIIYLRKEVEFLEIKLIVFNKVKNFVVKIKKGNATVYDLCICELELKGIYGEIYWYMLREVLEYGVF